MTDIALAAARSVATTWRSEAERRRVLSKHDPVADTLDYCAAELIEQLRPLDAPGASRSVEQFAADRGVTPQAVRKWIATGRLDAIRTPHGYRITREAIVRPARRKAS